MPASPHYLLAALLLLTAPAAYTGIDDPLNSYSGSGVALNAPATPTAAIAQPPVRVTASIATQAPTRTATARTETPPALNPGDQALADDTNTASR